MSKSLTNNRKRTLLILDVLVDKFFGLDVSTENEETVEKSKQYLFTEIPATDKKKQTHTHYIYFSFCNLCES